METRINPIPLVAIVGATASGKTGISLRLAQRFGGEIIAADSRTVYKKMNVGTAKPSQAEQTDIMHHCIDIVEPNQQLNVSQFKECADRAICDISSRSKVPFLVGGTGLYIDSVLYNFSFRGSSINVSQRERLQRMSVDELQQELGHRGIPLPTNLRNPRHLIRSIETNGRVAIRETLRPNTIVIGITSDMNELYDRIVERTHEMFNQGLLQEVRFLVSKYGWECQALQTIGYKEFVPYLEGLVSLEQVEAKIVQDTFRYAKRQGTWFRRNPDIHWISKIEDAVDLITSLLNN